VLHRLLVISVVLYTTPHLALLVEHILEGTLRLVRWNLSYYLRRVLFGPNVAILPSVGYMYPVLSGN